MIKEKILVIWSSPNKKNKSFSYELAKRFLKHYIELNQNEKDLTVEWLDLEEEAGCLQQLTKNVFTDKKSTFYSKIGMNFIEQLKSVDRVIFACAKINFCYPVAAKNYFDHIIIPGVTFSYKNRTSEKDATGLLNNLKVQILITQGSPEKWYLQGGDIKSSLAWIWKFIGAEVNEPFVIGSTNLNNNLDNPPSKLIDQYDNKIYRSAELFSDL